jgi:chitinase
VSLVEDTRRHFRGLARGWGISFTAPSSYWYMQHFQIGQMMEHVDFVNLMTYDLYGSWDKDSDWIGPYVYGHTNLTVIKQALNLLWRNNVPANQVNLGLGFYGRYGLSSPLVSMNSVLTAVLEPTYSRTLIVTGRAVSSPTLAELASVL